MKELYKDDQDMQNLLNQIGEVVVDYPKLFKKIWDNTHTMWWIWSISEYYFRNFIIINLKSISN